MKRRKTSFLLTKDDMELLDKLLYLEPWLMDNIDKAKKENNEYRVEFADCEMEDVLNALRFSADSGFPQGSEDKFSALYYKIKSYQVLSQGYGNSVL